MISGGGSSLLQIKEDDKFCARLLSKEASLANSSFRVYYGVAAAGSVPFRWESCPGTPKHTSGSAAAAAIPPLTPPPSYYFSSPRSRTKPAKNPAGSKSSFLSLPRLLVLKKATVGGAAAAPSMSPSSSLSQSSSSLSSSSSYSALSDHRRRPDDDDEAKFSGGGSLASTLCFGMRIFLVKKNALVQSTG